MTDTSEQDVDMRTLDCPYGCGLKLMINENNLGVFSSLHYRDVLCSGEGLEYRDGDEVFNTAYSRLMEAKKVSVHWFKEKETVNQILKDNENEIQKIYLLVQRISKQHG